MDDKSVRDTLKVASYSITKPYEASQVIEYIIEMSHRYICKDTYSLSIADGTAGSGGDTLNFTKYFSDIYAFEKDSMMFRLLKLKLKDKNNVKLFNDDFTRNIDVISEVNIIYLDPPWGGKSYKFKDHVDLTMDPTSNIYYIYDLVNQIFKINPTVLIFIKVPFNANTEKLPIKHTFDIYNRTGIISFKILLLKT